MTTVVLGHSGFIGKHIYKLLKKKQNSVIGGNSKNCNLLKKRQIKSFFKKKKNFNLIICSSLVRSKFDTKKSYNQNILMISNLIKVIDKKTIRKIIFLSSIDVYKKTGILNENNSKIKPDTKYGHYKLFAENLLKKYISKNKLTILRLTGVYDDDINGQNMISFIRRGLKKNYLNIKSSGEELRDYVHANDVAKTIYLFLKNDNYGVFNLASGVSKKVKYFVKKLNKTYSSNNLAIFYNPENHLNDKIVNVNKIKKVISIKDFKKI